jgi:16S rRNA (uracil1498-N3)-methyltransferase
VEIPGEVRNAAALAFVDDLKEPALAPDDAHHLLDVLRLRAGESVVAADGNGAYRLVTLQYVGRAGRRRTTPEARLESVGPIVLMATPEREIAVGLAVGKGDRPEWAVQKLTELGVDAIVFLETARGVVRPKTGAAAHRKDRLVRVAREAAMQSRRLRLPTIAGPLPLADALTTMPQPVALAEPGAPPLGAEPASVLVGPEGGFAPEELGLSPRHVGLPGFVLRTETAAVAAGALLAAWRANNWPSVAKSHSVRSFSPRSVVT